MLVGFSIALTLYAAGLAALALLGQIKRIAIVFAGMVEIVVLLALLSQQTVVFALVAVPAMLVILLCLPDRYAAGRREAGKPKDQAPEDE